MNKKMLFAAIAAFMGMSLLSSCSDTDELEEVSFANGKQINFSMVSKTTRGSAITGSNYLNTSLVPNMQVWAWFAGNRYMQMQQYGQGDDGVRVGDQYIGSNGNGIVIDNISKENPLTSIWDYHNPADVAFWPQNNHNLNFQAILPASDAEFTVSTTVANNIGHVVATVSVPTSTILQKDIMFAKSNEEAPRKADANTPVNFNFEHALSQIVFAGRVASNNMSVEINDIAIVNVAQKGKIGYFEENDTMIYPEAGGIKMDGTDDIYDVVLGSSVDENSALQTYRIGLIDNARLTPTENMEEPKNLTAANGALMLLPQDRSEYKWKTTAEAPVAIPNYVAPNFKDTYMTVSCKVKNGKTYILGDDKNFETVYIPFEVKWEQGKKYTYTIVFGDNVGAFKKDGKPLDKMLPITYSLSSVTEWNEINKGEHNIKYYIDEALPIIDAQIDDAIQQINSAASAAILGGNDTEIINALAETALSKIDSVKTASIKLIQGILTEKNLNTEMQNVKTSIRNTLNEYIKPINLLTPLTVETSLEAKDLGLSVKWANMNCEANSNIESGNYYRWMSVYGNDWISQGIHIASTLSENYSLAGDAANVKMGNKWRMPTVEETEEFIDNIQSELANIGGTDGYIITSKLNGAKIFLPICGAKDTHGESTELKYDSDVSFWIAKNSFQSSYARCLNHTPDGWNTNGQDALLSLPIRGVMEY